MNFNRQFFAVQLELNPKKVIIRKLGQGIDFVGYVLFEHHTLVRSKTKQRMKKQLKKGLKDYLVKKIDTLSMDQRIQSYLGILSHANQYSFTGAIKNAYWVRESKKFAAG